MAVRVGKGTPGCTNLLGRSKGIGLGEEGRILPKPLGTHAPGGIVINGIAGPDRSLVAAQHLPSQAKSWLKSRPTLLYSRRLRNTILTGNEKLVHIRVVVCHPTSDFRDGIGYIPCQAEIEGQVLGDSPIILNEGPVDFPAAAGNRAVERLIVQRDARQTHQKICFQIPRVRTKGNPEAVLEGLGAHIHLVSADADTELEIMLSADHVERIIYREDVGSALERRKAAIAKRPKGTCQIEGNACHPAAIGAADAGVVGVAAQVCADDAEVCGCTSPRALRNDVVEDAIVAKLELVHGCRRKDVSLPDGDVSRVIEDSLIAAKGILFRKTGGSARHIGTRLVVTEAGE